MRSQPCQDRRLRRCLGGRRGDLRAVQLRVPAAGRQQLVVAATLHDPAALDDEELDDEEFDDEEFDDDELDDKPADAKA